MTSRMQEIFFDVFEALPRQGPGSRDCTQRALSACSELTEQARILDLGCGSGAQTLDLAALTQGHIVAVDNHAPFIARLSDQIARIGLAHRVEALVAEMSALSYSPASFELIWSEGALYNIGLEAALPMCMTLLSPGGYLVFTEAVWRTDDPPDQARAAFADYPAMAQVEEVCALIKAQQWSLIDHFALPDSAWLAFYEPMERRIEQLRAQHAHDQEALHILDELEDEPKLYRRLGHHYGYEFFILRRP